MPNSTRKLCSVDDCSNIAKSRGMCTRHYDSFMRGDFGPIAGIRYQGKPDTLVLPCGGCDGGDYALWDGQCLACRRVA